MQLLDLPRELVDLVFEHLVLTIGIYKSVRFRLISKEFDRAILYAICDAQVVDLYDEATPWLSRHISTELKARILLNKAKACNAGPGDDMLIHQPLSIILQVSHTLGGLSAPTAGTDFKIAKAFSHRYIPPTADPIINNDIVRTQNTLSGAIVLGYLSLVMSILEQSPLPTTELLNAKSPFFGHPLPLAAAWGHLDIVRHLLQCGANPHLLGRDDYVVCEDLLWRKPYKYGHCEYLELPPYQQTDRSNEGSALRAAILNGHNDIATWLLRPRYCISTDTDEYMTTILAVSRHGSVSMLQRLVQATGKDLLTEVPWVAEELLRRAAHYRQTTFVEWLLDRGTNVNPIHSMRFYQIPCALSSACSQGNLALVRLLLSRGAKADFHHMFNNYNPSDPIELAARHGHLDVVELLLQHGARAGPALQEAANGGQARVVAWLCKRNRNIVRQSYSAHINCRLGTSALLSAIERLNRPIIRILIEAGVSLDTPYGKDRNPPIYHAKKYGHSARTKLLLSLGAKDILLPEKEVIGRVHALSYYSTGALMTERTWEWAGKY